MTRVKSKASAVIVAATMLSSTIGLGAAERTGLQDSINQAAKVLAAQPAAASKSSARRDGSQDPVPSVRARPASSGWGIPTWLKYTLVGAGAAGGGYALSQLGHHGGHDGSRGTTDNDATRR